MIFVGRFEHTLDPKGRVVLPAAFREHLAAGGFVTQGLDRCLSVWTHDEFEREASEMVQKMKDGRITRAAFRAFSSGASEIKPDGQGRIAIPTDLRRYAELRKDLVVIGAISSIEIWDAANWADEHTEGEAALGAPDAVGAE
jgi:MraZ protein